MSIEPADVEVAVADAGARQIVPLSGGKDSTALAIHLATRYPETKFEYVFADTGAELPETHAYFDRLQHILGVQVTRVTALDRFKVREKPGRSAFDVALYEHFAGFLPGPRHRWCTRVLKIAPFEAHVGGDRAYSYIGIRADESRAGYQGKPVLVSEQPNITPVYPFKDHGMGLGDVQRLLEDSGLGLPGYYEWRSRSGCFFCFYQQIGEWQGLSERHPDLFERAKAYETVKNGRRFTWVDGRTLDDVTRLPRRAMRAKDDEGCAICHL